MKTYALSPALAAILDATHLSVFKVSREGEFFLSGATGHRVAIGRIDEEGDISYYGKEPSPAFKEAIRLALIPFALDVAWWDEIRRLWSSSREVIWLGADGNPGCLIVYTPVHLTKPYLRWPGVAYIRGATPDQLHHGWYAEALASLDPEDCPIEKQMANPQWRRFYAELRQQFIQSVVNL